MLYFLITFSQMNVHTDTKRFIKTNRKNLQWCVLEIKCNRFISFGSCKPDTIKNKTPKPVIKKHSQNEPNPTTDNLD